MCEWSEEHVESVSSCQRGRRNLFIACFLSVMLCAVVSVKAAVGSEGTAKSAQDEKVAEILDAVRKAGRPVENMRLKWIHHLAPTGYVSAVPMTEWPRYEEVATAIVSGERSRIERVSSAYSEEDEQSQEPLSVSRSTRVFDGERQFELKVSTTGRLSGSIISANNNWGLLRDRFGWPFDFDDEAIFEKHVFGLLQGPAPGIYIVAVDGRGEQFERYELTIDGNRGFHIVRMLRFRNLESKMHQVDVELKQYREGIWYISSSTKTRYKDVPGGGQTFTVDERMEITEAAFNIEVPEETFEFEFPPGTRVKDFDRNETYTVPEAGSKPDPQREKEAIRNGLVTRLEGLQNIVVKYDLEWIPTPSRSDLEADGEVGPGGTRLYVAKDPVKTHEQYWHLHDRMRHESRLSDETIEFNQKHHSYTSDVETIDVYTRHKSEVLYHANTANPYSGEIDNPGGQLAIDREIEYGLGLKCVGTETWLTVSDFENADIETLPNGNVAVSMKVRNTLHKWTHNPNLGYALVLYEIGTRNRWILKNSNFKNVDGFMLPMKIENQRFQEEDGRLVVVDTKRITVHEYSLNHPENTPDKYNIVWPSWASVYDHRIGLRLEADDAGKLHPVR